MERFAFRLPIGLRADSGELIRDGVLRLPRVADELDAASEPEVARVPRAFHLHLMARIVQQLGPWQKPGAELLRRMYAADFRYLVEFCRRAEEKAAGGSGAELGDEFDHDHEVGDEFDHDHEVEHEIEHVDPAPIRPADEPRRPAERPGLVADPTRPRPPAHWLRDRARLAEGLPLVPEEDELEPVVMMPTAQARARTPRRAAAGRRRLATATQEAGDGDPEPGGAEGEVEVGHKHGNAHDHAHADAPDHDHANADDHDHDHESANADAHARDHEGAVDLVPPSPLSHPRLRASAIRGPTSDAPLPRSPRVPRDRNGSCPQAQEPALTLDPTHRPDDHDHDHDHDHENADVHAHGHDHESDRDHESAVDQGPPSPLSHPRLRASAIRGPTPSDAPLPRSPRVPRDRNGASPQAQESALTLDPAHDRPDAWPALPPEADADLFEVLPVGADGWPALPLDDPIPTAPDVPAWRRPRRL